MAEKTATFAVNLAGNVGEVAAKDAAELETLRAKIEQSQVALKGMSSALRSLKGESEEVAKAKEHLKARLDAEKGAVSQANLALLKQGQTYEQLQHRMRLAEAAQKKLEAKKQTDLLKHQAEQTKKLADGQKRQAAEAKRQAEETKKLAEGHKKLGEGFRAAGGPLGELHAKLTGLRDLAGGTNGSMGLLAAGVGIVVAAVVALTVATVAAAVKLGIFVITGANALRSMNLMREAVAGSAENAANLGTQVDFMARKVATSKVALNEMAVSITRSLSGGMSKASGQAIVDTFAAVSQAAAAAGDDTGAALRELVERGKLVGRFWANPFELQGKGLQFQDIALALSKNLGVGIDKARQALFDGRVKLADGAAALRTAVETKFGKVNAEKLLDIDVQFEKLHERLVGLTKGVVLEPLLKGLATFLSKFDETTVTGKSIQLIFTNLGNAIAGISVAHLGDAVEGIETIVLWGLRAAEVMKGMGEALDNPIAQTALKGLEVVAVGVGVSIAAVAAAVGLLALGFGAAVKAGEWLIDKFFELDRWAHGVADTMKGAGKAIVDGLIGGIIGGADRAIDAVKNLASKIKGVFTGALDIHSPSKVFAEYGKQTTAGYAQGVQRGSPGAQQAVESMAPSAPAPRASAVLGGASGGGQSIVVHVAINLPEGMKSQPAHETAKAITAPGILRELTRAIREGLVTQGVPTQAAAT